jgi:hypothetical protein
MNLDMHSNAVHNYYILGRRKDLVLFVLFVFLGMERLGKRRISSRRISYLASMHVQAN